MSSVVQPPALKPHELEMQRKVELLRKVKGLREGTLLNRSGLLKGDPAKEYCWVNNSPDRRITYESMGWEAVKITDPKNPSVVTRVTPQPDGTIVRGDLILYHIDKDLFEAIQNYNVIRGLELTENKDEGFETQLERMGVRSYKPKV